LQIKKYGTVLGVFAQKTAPHLILRFHDFYIIWKRAALPSDVNASRVPFTAPTLSPA
jgi:hypothetical protein